MIDELQVENIALIKHASLIPARGLTVITGETGAGKTALLTACKLLCGERADASMVREGADSLVVQGRFFAAQPSDDAGAGDEAFDAAEGLVAKRSVSADGRSRVSIAGHMAAVGDLAVSVGTTIDLCGQHEHQRLMKAGNHRAMLEAWAGDAVSSALERYQEHFAKAQQAAEEVRRIEEAASADAASVEQARYTLARINEVAPQEGEYEQLRADVPKIENREQLKAAVETAHSALAGEEGALDAIARGLMSLDSMASVEPRLADLSQSLRDASYITEDVAREVRRIADDVDYDTDALEHLQNRLGELQGLMRTWGPTIDQVLEARQRAEQLLQAVDGYDEQLAKVRAQHDQAEAHLAQSARALHQARLDAAPGFEQAVTQHMQKLHMEGAGIVCQVDMLDRSQWREQGPDAIEFLFRPGADITPRPLTKIASGGELSRVLLAIKVALGHDDDVDTLIFDEVDAGVGGSAARALSDTLFSLARTHQVIVVTHLAQIAALADAHYVVEKTDGASPETLLTCVEGEGRVAELARMLSGDTKEVSLEHARHMIDEAQAYKAAAR